MTNKVVLNGYITDEAKTIVSSDGRERTTFTLNVQRNHDDEVDDNSNAYDYIPIIIYGSDDDSGLPKDYINVNMKIIGRLITYPDSFGKIHWGVLASSAKVDEKAFNPFTPSTN